MSSVGSTVKLWLWSSNFASHHIPIQRITPYAKSRSVSLILDKLTNDQTVSAAENEGKTTGKVRGIYEIGNLSLPKLLEALAL